MSTRRASWTLLVVALVAVAAWIGWNRATTLVLRLQDIAKFELQVRTTGEGHELHISGFPEHSHMPVRSVEELIRGDTLILKATCVFGGGPPGGKFEYRVVVPAGVRRVVFGDEEEVIWAAR